MADIEAMWRDAEHPSEAQETDLASVAADLSAAFAGDAMFDWFLRTDARRDEARDKLFAFIVKKLAWAPGASSGPLAAARRRCGCPSSSSAPRPSSRSFAHCR